MFLCSDELFVVQKGKGGGSSKLLALPAAIRTRKRVRAFHEPVTKQLGHHPARTHGKAAVLPTAQRCSQAVVLPRLRVRIRANLSQNNRASAGRSPSSTRASSNNSCAAPRSKANTLFPDRSCPWSAGPSRVPE